MLVVLESFLIEWGISLIQLQSAANELVRSQMVLCTHILESSLIELKSSVIEYESSVIEFESSVVEL